MMRYRYIIPMFCLCSTMSLYAQEKGLGNILQDMGEKKTLLKPVPKKQQTKKKTRFVFKDEYESKKISSKDKMDSESYEYENKSRFKFKFNDGSEQSNFMSMHTVSGAPGANGIGSSGGGSAGRGR